MKASISIASRLKVSPTVIGVTVVAGGTSAPEIMTSFMASFKDVDDIAIGNIIGSNIFNILGILGLTTLIKTSFVERSFLNFDLYALLFFTFLFTVLIHDQNISGLEGATFLFLLMLFLGWTVHRSRQGPPQEVSKSEEGGKNENDMKVLKKPIYDISYMLFGLGALIAGAQWALSGGVSLGEAMGLSERVIGLTIISVGTGLPELATSLAATLRGWTGLAVANVVGSNIMNTLAVPAVASLSGSIHVGESLSWRDSYILIAVTLLLFAALQLSGGKLHRLWGSLFVMSYAGYIYYLYL